MDKVNWDVKFSDIVEQNKTCLYEICKCSMKLLEENAETAREGFQYFLTRISPPRYSSDDIPDELFEVNEEEIDPFTQKRIREMESQIIRELIFQDVTEETFYTEIWKRVSDKLLVSDSYQRAFFLRLMWLDSRIPYYRLGLGMIMDEEKYQECVKQLEVPYRKMQFVMNAGYPRRTQKVSILMKIAEEIQDPEQRIVFWALTLGKLEKRIVDLKKRVNELESALELEDDEL